MKVLLVIAAVLLLLLWTRVSFGITVKNGHASVVLRYLFLRITLFPGKPDSGTRKIPGKKQKSQKKQEETEEPPKQTMSALEMAKTGIALFKASGRGLHTLRRHLVFSHVEIYLCAGGRDAHQTGIGYAKLMLVVQAALDIIGRMFVLRKPKVAIAPDFTAPKTRYEIGMRIGIRPVFVLLAAIRLLRDTLPILLRARKKKQPARSQTAVSA